MPSSGKAISTYLVGVEVAVPKWLFACVRLCSPYAQKAGFCSLGITKDSSFSLGLPSKLSSTSRLWICLLEVPKGGVSICRLWSSAYVRSVLYYTLPCSPCIKEQH